MLKFLAQALKRNLAQQNVNIKQYNLITVFIVLVRLGGLPPLIGFFPKVIILSSISTRIFRIRILLIMSSVIDLFIYTRIAYFGLINKKSEILWLEQRSRIGQITIVITFITFNLFIII
jgi:NADH:ubiquinone oxidoreductase subunit 2 (subunit N)